MTRRRILFADDDVLCQWIMTEVLTSAGYAVSGVCRAADAMRLIESRQQDFDLLLTDVALPDDAGSLRLVEAWQQRFALRPVIYMGPDPNCHDVLASGSAAIAKPLSASRLLSMIDFALSETDVPLFTLAASRRRLHVH